MTLHCGINIHQQLLINLGLVIINALNCFLVTITASQTQVFLETGLPTFDTVMHNSACVFARSLQNCANGLVQYVKVLCDNC